MFAATHTLNLDSLKLKQHTSCNKLQVLLELSDLETDKHTDRPYLVDIPSLQSPVAIGYLLLTVPCLARVVDVVWIPDGRGGRENIVQETYEQSYNVTCSHLINKTTSL